MFRTDRITVRVNKSVLERAEKVLAKYHLTVSEYMRDMIVWTVKCPDQAKAYLEQAIFESKKNKTQRKA